MRDLYRWTIRMVTLVLLCGIVVGLELDIHLPLMDAVSTNDLCPYEFGILSNRRLMEIDFDHQEQVHFSSHQHIPHVSLFLTQFLADEVEDIVSTVAYTIQKFSNQTKQDSCEVELSSEYSIGSGYAIWKVVKSPCLQQLSNIIVMALEPFVDKKNIIIPDWVQNLPEPQRAKKINFLLKYGSPNVFSEFQPHMTVGFNTHTTNEQKEHILESTFQSFFHSRQNCMGGISKVGIGHVGKQGGTVLQKGLIQLNIHPPNI